MANVKGNNKKVKTESFDVHAFEVVRVKVSGVRASDQREAITLAGKEYDARQLFASAPAVAREGVTVETEYAEEVSHYLVDRVKDKNHSQSRFYMEDGKTVLPLDGKCFGCGRDQLKQGDATDMDSLLDRVLDSTIRTLAPAVGHGDVEFAGKLAERVIRRLQTHLAADLEFVCGGDGDGFGDLTEEDSTLAPLRRQHAEDYYGEHNWQDEAHRNGCTSCQLEWDKRLPDGPGDSTVAIVDGRVQ